jgi:hypothetical protein
LSKRSVRDVLRRSVALHGTDVDVDVYVDADVYVDVYVYVVVVVVVVVGVDATWTSHVVVDERGRRTLDVRRRRR